ncbi:leucine-rich repeat domain-containing protein [Ruminococcus sp.]|uniref:leucine-rich repeat domain-containing protein n=1 Tax=Ruminococcus sp. TaxID=41978 RepID=UPI003452395C|nr:leucine-rich repeat domain-containing protein [Ruminococcus sp.]
MNKLEKLYLTDNSVTDVSPLYGHTSLKVLHLWQENSRIPDLTPLFSLAGLEELSFTELWTDFQCRNIAYTIVFQP